MTKIGKCRISASIRFPLGLSSIYVLEVIHTLGD